MIAYPADLDRILINDDGRFLPFNQTLKGLPPVQRTSQGYLLAYPNGFLVPSQEISYEIKITETWNFPFKNYVILYPAHQVLKRDTLITIREVPLYLVAPEHPASALDIHSAYLTIYLHGRLIRRMLDCIQAAKKTHRDPIGVLELKSLGGTVRELLAADSTISGFFEGKGIFHIGERLGSESPKNQCQHGII